MRRAFHLNEEDIPAFRATLVFLKGRLRERDTINWALRLTEADTAKRLALLDTLAGPEGTKLTEPWRAAWRLIEEALENPSFHGRTTNGLFFVRQRIRSGDRSGALVQAIVELVKPRLALEPFSDLSLRFRPPPKRPKKTDDLFSARLKSGDVIDPEQLGLRAVREVEFVESLARELEGALAHGLEVGRRIGWDGKIRFWRLGGLHRVYFVQAQDRALAEHEPDEFHRGIAPCTKLLYEAVQHLAELKLPIAQSFARRWRVSETPVHLRLFAAIARDAEIAAVNEVANFLLGLDDRAFWDTSAFPEVAELRARRFGEMDVAAQAAIESRVRKGPPKSLWPRTAKADQVKVWQVHWALRELRRIELCGTLSPATKAWLNDRASAFDDITQMTRIDHGFLGMPEARWVPPSPDERFDQISGRERLIQLEAALSQTEGWGKSPSERAADWIREGKNSSALIADFEEAGQDIAYPRTWEEFGWSHSPTRVSEEGGVDEFRRVLVLLRRLPEGTMSKAIDGLSHWLSTWGKDALAIPDGFRVWELLWPRAVEAANSTNSASDDDTALEEKTFSDLDALNTAVGKLVGVFLAACPSLVDDPQPFSRPSIILQMRNKILSSTGRARLIAQHRLIEVVSYFLKADREWTQQHLISPLMEETLEGIELWRAVALQPRYTETLKVLGPAMIARSGDVRIDREARESLVFSLILDTLNSLLDGSEAAVSKPQIQQMIRSVDDEVRSHAAETAQRYLRENSTVGPDVPNPIAPEHIFRKAICPFFQTIWPQERSLVTPGVSRAVADLPAAAGSMFVEAVALIEQLLVPFECWSISDFGFLDEVEGRAKLSSVDSSDKAASLLRLLDFTIGRTEGAIVPYDLGDALNQVEKVAPALVNSQIFRRLATLARRA